MEDKILQMESAENIAGRENESLERLIAFDVLRFMLPKNFLRRYAAFVINSYFMGRFSRNSPIAAVVKSKLVPKLIDFIIRGFNLHVWSRNRRQVLLTLVIKSAAAFFSEDFPETKDVVLYCNNLRVIDERIDSWSSNPPFSDSLEVEMIHYFKQKINDNHSWWNMATSVKEVKGIRVRQNYFANSINKYREQPEMDN